MKTRFVFVTEGDALSFPDEETGEPAFEPDREPGALG